MYFVSFVAHLPASLPSMLDLASHCLYTALVEFPCPSKIDHFIHIDGDRKTEF